MGIFIADHEINSLCIIDDDEGARASYVEAFYDTSFNAIAQEEVNDISLFFDNSLRAFDAVISDHQLKKKKNYFPINGAQVVSMCYERNIPSVLVTKYDQAQMSEIRKFRKNIPVILNPSQFDEDTVINSLEVCIKEFKGEIRADRKLWRTLVRIDAIEENHIYIIIPGWDTSEAIAIGKDELPAHIKPIIDLDKRMHIEVNVGCESVNDLYFGNWEIK
jgi:hypothetical protein